TSQEAEGVDPGEPTIKGGWVIQLELIISLLEAIDILSLRDQANLVSGRANLVSGRGA
ncbi:MAG: hypothetical protein JO063_11925, partial [Pseudonocardiales bacterium]|nr:hypothetical protein [Pseudonocardiales bacterium]